MTAPTNNDISASTEVANSPKENELATYNHFCTPIYSLNNKSYLKLVSEISKEYLKKAKKDTPYLDPIYPVYQTESFLNDARLSEFIQYVSQVGWDILNSQGYDMMKYNTYVVEMWCQEHYKHSAMEQHVHGYGEHLVGFYFLDCPEGSTKVIFHDPRPGKVQLSLPEVDMAQATYASNMINFVPEPGMLMITNSSVAHSFTRNAVNAAVRFVHFNISAVRAPASTSDTCPTASTNDVAEII